MCSQGSSPDPAARRRNPYTAPELPIDGDETVDVGPEPVVMTDLTEGDRISVRYEPNDDSRRRTIVGEVVQTNGGSVIVEPETDDDDPYRVDRDGVHRPRDPNPLGRTRTVNRIRE